MRRQAGEYLPGLGFAEVYFQFQDAVGVGVFFRCLLYTSDAADEL